MSLLESLKHLPEDLAAAIRRATESGDAEVSVEPGLEIKMKLVIRPGSSGDDLDLDGKSLEELEELLDDLQRELDIVLGDEPEDEDSDEFSDWEDLVDELEDQINEVQDAIDFFDDTSD